MGGKLINVELAKGEILYLKDVLKNTREFLNFFDPAGESIDVKILADFINKFDNLVK